MNQPNNTFIRSRFFLVFLFILSMGLSDLQAQLFKSYYHNKDFFDATHFTAQKLILIPGTREVAFSGELKGADAPYDAHGYIMHTDQDGQVKHLHTLTLTSTNASNGIRATGLAMDKNLRYYIGGSTVDDLSANSSTAEKTVTCLAYDGKFEWSRMQGFYNFESVGFDMNDNSLVTLSGQSNMLKPADLMIQKFSDTGVFLGGVRIETIFADQPVELLVLHGGEGYVAVGMIDTAADTRPLIVRLDDQLNVLWSHVYEISGNGWQVEDADVLQQGPLGISGSISDNVTGLHHPFVMNIDMNTGQPLWFQKYSINGSHEAKGLGLAAWQDFYNPQDQGWLLAGAWSEGIMTDRNRRAFTMKLGAKGKPEWTRNYSNFPPTEYDLDEFATDIIFIPSTNQFSVLGEHTRFQGSDLDRRMTFLVRAGLNNGSLSAEDSPCSASLSASMTDDKVTFLDIGNPIMEGSANAFTYPTQALTMHATYCSYSDKVNPKIQAPIAIGWRLDNHLLTVPFGNPKSGEAAEAQLFDITGKLVRQVSLNPETDKVSMQTEGIPAGIYLLRILQGKRVIQSEKVRIE